MTPILTTQTERILFLLQARPVCGTDFLDMRIPRYAARIHELRTRGHRIESRRCENPRHRHGSRQIEYVLAEPTLF